MNTILRRKQFTVSKMDYIYSKLDIFCPNNNRCFCCPKKTKERVNLVHKAERMLYRDLDVVTILRTNQLSNVLRMALLTPAQRLLLFYQKKQVVEK